MGNLIGGLQRFIRNKNTVTILAAIAGILVLWVGYNMRLNEAISPVQVPVAKVVIGATEEITVDKIELVEISSDFISGTEVITNQSLLIGKYVTTGTSIAAGDLFMSSQVVDKYELPNAIFDDIPEGDGLFYLPVNNNSTYGNSIYPGDRIDLYVRYTDELGILNFGKFIEKIEVLAVRTSSQEDVFESTEVKQSALLLFTVPDEMFNLLNNASKLGLEIIPVPRNKEYTTSAGTTQITSAAIKYYIESKSAFTTDPS